MELKVKFRVEHLMLKEGGNLIYQLLRGGNFSGKFMPVIFPAKVSWKSTFKNGRTRMALIVSESLENFGQAGAGSRLKKF